MKLGIVVKMASQDEWRAHDLSLSKGDVFFKVDTKNNHIEKLREQFRKIAVANEINKDKGRPEIEIDLEIDIYYKKRSPEAARLMFALEGIIVKMLNKELKSAREQWTHEQIHEQGLENHSPRMYLIIPKEHINIYLEDLKNERSRIISVKEIDDKNVRIDYYLSSNKWDTKLMHTYIEALVSDLDSMGVGRGDGVMDIIFADWEEIQKKEKGKEYTDGSLFI